MILHIASDNTKYIIYPFIDFVNQNFNKNEHFYILCSKDKDIKRFENAITKDIFTQTDFFIQQMKKADKIILHGFWYDKIFDIYFNFPEFFDKTIWRPWGGEYYYCNDVKCKEFIKKIKYIVHFMQEEYDLIKERFDNKGEFFELLSYEQFFDIFKFRNLCFESNFIQIGNSADPSNEHLILLQKVKKSENVLLPFVYGGDKNYRKKIIVKVKKEFPNNFILLKPLNYVKYIKLLSKVKVGLFNHKRQQSLGNMIILLLLGKKIYLRNDITSWFFFKRLGLEIFDISDEVDKNFSKMQAMKNIRILNKFFNKKRLLNDLDRIFKI